MLVAVAVVPQTPLLVPKIASGAAAELDDLRDAATQAVREVCADADRVLVVAGGPADTSYERVAVDFSAYGLEGEVGAGEVSTRSARSTSGEAAVSLVERAQRVETSPRAGSSLPLGAWLLDRAGVTLPRAFRETTGAALDVPADGRTALVVLADGTARRSDAAPGYVDVRSLGYDAAIATALAAGDVAALASLDPVLGVELWAHGVPGLRALGATLQSAGLTPAKARVAAEADPYGVAYWVAAWTLAG